MFSLCRVESMKQGKKLCDAFNKKFNLNLTLGKLRDLNTKRGLNIGNSYKK